MTPVPSIPALLEANLRLVPPPGQERWLTGYSDASFKDTPPNQGGGWGCWVRDDKTRILRSGLCPSWVRNAQDAELCGVLAAVHTALTGLNATWANIMVIKLDNQGVARWFGWQGGGAPEPPERADLVRRTLQAANDKRIRLVVTWVKGHRKDRRDTSVFLNAQVDQMAGTARLTGQGTKRVERVWGAQTDSLRP